MEGPMTEAPVVTTTGETLETEAPVTTMEGPTTEAPVVTTTGETLKT